MNPVNHSKISLACPDCGWPDPYMVKWGRNPDQFWCPSCYSYGPWDAVRIGTVHYMKARHWFRREQIEREQRWNADK